MTSETKNPVQPQWAIVANIVKERPYGEGGLETRNGTKHFRGGAKVYIIDSYPGMCERIIVIGMHRNSRKYITNVINVEHVTNLRMKLVHDPSINERIANHYSESGNRLGELELKNLLELIPDWQKEIETLHNEKRPDIHLNQEITVKESSIKNLLDWGKRVWKRYT